MGTEEETNDLERNKNVERLRVEDENNEICGMVLDNQIEIETEMVMNMEANLVKMKKKKQ